MRIGSALKSALQFCFFSFVFILGNVLPGYAASIEVRPVSSDLAPSASVLSQDSAAVPAEGSEGASFDFSRLIEMAKDLAGRAYVPPAPMSQTLRDLAYDQLRNIRYNTDLSLWRQEGLPFEVQFFQDGFYFDRSVAIHVVEPTGKVVPVPFSVNLFNYPDDVLKTKIASADAGFAGFRIHFPLNRTDYKDEVASFLGASYFRAVGNGNWYGLSARGLALNTALPSGEEFPWFREFWLVKPGPSDETITLYALLDSPSCAGAYRFHIMPGDETDIAVDMKVFFRNAVEKVGIAPLTSMYLYGETENGQHRDYRPEVHDSDGLMIRTASGEWIWRALNNGIRLKTSQFPLKDVKGFGLLQRDRNFDHYQDLESYYEKRPSLWIEPTSNWGSGKVELVEIPSDMETNDNMVAFWVPDDPVTAGTCLSYSYLMRWTRHEDRLHLLGRVVATRRAEGDRKDWVRFVLDFAGGELDSLSPDSGLTSVIQAEGGKVIQKHLEKNPHTGGWRLSFQVEPDGDDKFSVFPAVGNVIRVSAFLKKGDNIPDPLTETWDYAFFK